MLDWLGLGAVLGGRRRRSRRSPSLLLWDFFIMFVILADLAGATAIAMLPLVARFSNARAHQGLGRPLGATSLRARAVTLLAGPKLFRGGLLQKALRNCFYFGTSAAIGFTREQPPRLERVAM